jgi:hypothetical protein
MQLTEPLHFAANINSMDIAGIIIDGGGAINIISNCIEGNAGPAIILTAGIWGAPAGILIQANYYEDNNVSNFPSFCWPVPAGRSDFMLLLAFTYIISDPALRGFVVHACRCRRSSSARTMATGLSVQTC